MRGQVASFPLGEKEIGHLTLNVGRLKKRFPKRGEKNWLPILENSEDLGQM